MDVAAVSIQHGESLGSAIRHAAGGDDHAFARGTPVLAGDGRFRDTLQTAGELDPNFAAYAALSGSYFNLGGPLAADAREAYELREKATERERFAIEALYYMS